MPNVRSGFAWTGDSVKSLAGQGAVYVRLTKDFSIVSVSDGSDSSDDLIHVSLVSVCELLFVWIFEIYNSVCANVLKGRLLSFVATIFSDLRFGLLRSTAKDFGLF